MKPQRPSTFILDVDGVLTSGQFYYSKEGKAFKCFGADDHDALVLLKRFVEIRFVTGDKKGFDISRKRIVDDMSFPLDLVSTIRRVDWISQRYDLDSVIYMGDGIFDHLVMQKVAYSIAPFNADANAKNHASFVTKRSGGDRAVAEAVIHLFGRFFEEYDPYQLPSNNTKLSGDWAV